MSPAAFVEGVLLVTVSKKTLIWIGLFIGSTIGGYLPALWGSDVFSFSSVLGSAIGGIGGIWLGFKTGD
jgi:hypothetical protein